MELLLKDEQNKKHLHALRENISNVVPFLGAGTSIPYGYPSWPELVLKVLYSMHLNDEDHQKIKDEIDNGCYMNATKEMYKNCYYLEEHVYNEIGKINPINKSSCLEKYIHLFPSGLYLTTNYDDVVENILRPNIPNLFTDTPTDSIVSAGLKSSQKSMLQIPSIIYLHGKYDKSKGIIFSEEDYNDFYGNPELIKITGIKKRPFAQKMLEAYTKYPLLFIGCSMNMKEDRMLRLLERINDLQQRPDHFSYALLDATDLDQNKMKDKEKDLFKIKVLSIWYENDHERAKEELFEYLLSKERKEYEAGQEEHEKKQKKQKEMYELEQKKKEEKEKERRKQQEEIEKRIEKIEDPSNLINTFPYLQKYSKGSDCYYEFVLSKVDDQYYLSDQKRTYEMLDQTFELKERDVIKNLVAILKECDVHLCEQKLIIPLGQWSELPNDEQEKSLEEAKCRLFTCVSFMDKMRIFYV